MKNPFQKINPQTRQMLIGGLVGSLSYYAELALTNTQSWYPDELKGRLNPKLPRNGELISTIAPPAVMLLASKKWPKIKNVAVGTLLYSGPNLMQRLIVNAANPASASLPMQFAVASPTVVPAAPIPIRPPASTPQMMSRYR